MKKVEFEDIWKKIMDENKGMALLLFLVFLPLVYRLFVLQQVNEDEKRAGTEIIW